MTTTTSNTSSVLPRSHVLPSYLPFMAKDPRTSYVWKTKIRPAILDRDGHACQIRGPKCTTRATVVDHVLPLSLGGDPFDPVNLRAACVACNSGRRLGQPGRAPRPPLRRAAYAFATQHDDVPFYPGPSRNW